MKLQIKMPAMILALALCVSLCPVSLAEDAVYAQTLFDQSKPIEIDIQMDDETWNNMIATASSEEYSVCNLVVNGVLYENVAIRPKGNSSLASVSSRGSERFSWRIKFDKYEKKRKCDGLDILILNNGFQDPGQLKEAIAYDMYAFLGADASLYNYAIVYHNGEYFGTYLALEGVDKSFAKRVYGEDYGKLYKPELSGGANRDKEQDALNDDGEGFGNSFGGAFGGHAGGGANGFGGSFGSQAGGNDGSFGGSSGAPAADGQNTYSQNAPADGGSGFGGSFGGQAGGNGNNMPAAPDQNGGGFAMFGAGGGAKSDSQLAMALNYVGDDLETYQGIWDSAKFKSDDEDHARVVEALKHVSERDDIGDYVDIDNVLKYMAIQAFIYNNDSLTDEEAHNYYLYEENGSLNLIPWDMNQAFSMTGNGNDYVNFPIDTPFTVSDLSQRDFFMALLENEEYLAQYHEYLRQLSEEYVQGGWLEETYNRIRSQIDALVETDPTAFCTYNEFDASATSLKLAIELRAKGVLGQISGEIPSTREGQEAEPDKLLDVSGEDLSGLTSGFGMGGGNFNFAMPNFPGMK
ncbi:MAG: CotH kinase family protein [Clostridia bacterium]|nr:CotH kinase family protein [Clostridia bacterium]